MSKTLNELKVLKKLNITDFKHLTKDKVIKMASMLDKMDPEVAKKALEQFPQFSTTAKDILNDYKDTLDKGLETNKESVQTFYDMCNSIIQSLQKQLEVENLLLEEKIYIMDKMSEILKMVSEKDSENKKFISTMSLIGAVFFSAVVIALGTALGNNTKIEKNDDDTF